MSATPPAPAGRIRVRGARAHNLRHIDVEFPRGALVAVTGVSGGGKSSFAVDVLHRWGEGRYLESLSPALRAHLGPGSRPEVDGVEGLPPTLCVPADPPHADARATLASLSDLLDYLRVLWAVAGEALCPRCHRPLARRSPSEIAAAVAALPEGTRLLVLAPLHPGVEPDPAAAVERARREGLVRVRIGSALVELDGGPVPPPPPGTEVAGVVDRIVIRGDVRSRLQDSAEAALRLAGGVVAVARPDDAPHRDLLFSERFGCPRCGTDVEPPLPSTFSWWSPRGACPRCTGTGTVLLPAVEALAAALPRGSLVEALPAALGALPRAERRAVAAEAAAFLESAGLSAEAPVSAVPGEALAAFLRASVGPRILRRAGAGAPRARRGAARALLEESSCPDCDGTRLHEVARAVRVAGLPLPEFLARTVDGALPWMEGLRCPGTDAAVLDPLREEAVRRLRLLARLGLGYLGLHRPASTLSGGEVQRARLAAHLGGGLAGVQYVLDEPTAGLHPSETERLLGALRGLRDQGNGVLVVEHDPDVLAAADWILEIGPGAGRDGGRVVFSGPLEEFRGTDTLSARWLRREHRPPPRGGDPKEVFRRGALSVLGVERHNLRGLDARFPVARLTVVAGVSGSGKSTLVRDVLLRAMRRLLHDDPAPAGAHRALRGAERFRRAIEVDGTRVGRAPRAVPATWTGAWDIVRRLLAETDEARIRGFGPERFSFNRDGGRCPACEGRGRRTVEMHLLPSVEIPCDACGGHRFERETLRARWRGASAADILEMTVSEALAFFRNVARLADVLEPVQRVGLGYVPLGQPLDTLSGGERQRLRLAGELASLEATGTLLVLDEPTVGLHPEDVLRLVDVLRGLTDAGATVVAIDHDPELLRRADWVLELGPGAGPDGGRLVAEGTPAALAEAPTATGPFLRS